MKTALSMVLVGVVMGQYDGPIPQPDYVPPQPGNGGNGDTAPATPPADKGTTDPAPVDPYQDQAPVDPAPVDDYDDQAPDTTDPTPDPVYDDAGPIDTPYAGDVAPVDDYTDAAPVDKPYDDNGDVDDSDDDEYDDGDVAPVYEAPAQKESGVLYVDVIKHWLQHVLKHIPQEVIAKLISLLEELIGYVKNLDPQDPASLAKVIDHVKTIGSYCDEHIVDDNTKQYVVEAFTQMQKYYPETFNSAVDDQVYNAWDHLWNSCKDIETTLPEHVDQFYKAYSGYLESGPKSPAYTKDIDHLCESHDPTVSKYANDTKTAIETLSEEADGQAVEAAASTMTFGLFTMVAGVAAFFF